jgi:hypothetical protein
MMPSSARPWRRCRRRAAAWVRGPQSPPTTPMSSAGRGVVAEGDHLQQLHVAVAVQLAAPGGAQQRLVRLDRERLDRRRPGRGQVRLTPRPGKLRRSVHRRGGSGMSRERYRRLLS